MEVRRPIVVRLDEAVPAPGPPTAGMDRRTLLDRDDAWAGWVRTDAGVAGGWHHHGERDSYIYVLRGNVRVDFGPGGREAVTARAGDFVFNPARMIHREVTSPEEPAELFIIRLGPGPLNVNVDGPEAAREP